VLHHADNCSTRVDLVNCVRAMEPGEVSMGSRAGSQTPSFDLVWVCWAESVSAKAVPTALLSDIHTYRKGVKGFHICWISRFSGLSYYSLQYIATAAKKSLIFSAEVSIETKCSILRPQNVTKIIDSNEDTGVNRIVNNGIIYLVHTSAFYWATSPYHLQMCLTAS